MKRQKSMLKMLCGFEEDVFGRITSVGQGLKQMREQMKRVPVFLAIDSVTNDDRSRKEAHDYLMVGFHPESRIMITSRTEVVLQDLLPDLKSCMPMPSLSEIEAGAIFLRSAVPMKSISVLTNEERSILGLCIERCLFESEGNKSWPRMMSYHPLALSAFGDFFYKLRNSDMLVWKDHLETNSDLLNEVWTAPSVLSIIGLQFNTLRPSEQLLFLDIALYRETGLTFLYYVNEVEWLSVRHGGTEAVMERKLRDLRRSGMIRYRDEYHTVHDLYKEFAKWYVTEHHVNWMKNAWGVFQRAGVILSCDSPASKCWSDLVWLRIFDSNARFLPRKAMQEMPNLVVLQLHCCDYLPMLDLQGLNCLRHLELVGLPSLVTVTLTGSSSTDESVGIFNSLQFVVLVDLESLTVVPDFRSCTALQSVLLITCSEVTNWEGIECPQLKSLSVSYLITTVGVTQLPKFESLHSLVNLLIRVDSCDECSHDCYVEWCGQGTDGLPSWDFPVSHYEMCHNFLDSCERCRLFIQDVIDYMSTIDYFQIDTGTIDLDVTLESSTHRVLMV